jgi:hypothetical protein
MRLLLALSLAAACMASDASYVELTLKDGRVLTGYHDSVARTMRVGPATLTIEPEQIVSSKPAKPDLLNESAPKSTKLTPLDGVRMQLAAVRKDIERSESLRASLEREDQDATKRMQSARSDDQRRQIEASNRSRGERMSALSDARVKLDQRLAELTEQERTMAEGDAERRQGDELAAMEARRSEIARAATGGATTLDGLRARQEENRKRREALDIEEEEIQKAMGDLIYAMHMQVLKDADLTPLEWVEAPTEKAGERDRRRRDTDMINRALADLAAFRGGRRDVIRGLPFQAIIGDAGRQQRLQLLRGPRPALYEALRALP